MGRGMLMTLGSGQLWVYLGINFPVNFTSCSEATHVYT